VAGVVFELAVTEYHPACAPMLNVIWLPAVSLLTATVC
jgi:hypothetical protein